MDFSPVPCLFALGTLLAACGVATSFAPSQGVCPKRSNGCQFELISGAVARDYQVIGVIDLEAFSARNLPNDESSFRRAIGPDVCRVGGDAVIAGVNGDHRYVLATVVKWVDDGQRAPVCPAALPDAGVRDAGSDGATKDAATKNQTSAATPECGAGEQAGAAC